MQSPYMIENLSHNICKLTELIKKQYVCNLKPFIAPWLRLINAPVTKFCFVPAIVHAQLAETIGLDTNKQKFFICFPNTADAMQP